MQMLTQLRKKDEDYDPSSNSESDYMSDFDMDADVDEIGKDRVPSHILDVAYNKDDPPMEEGNIYPNMHEFKLALATHAIKNEFEYNIEKSESGRYRMYCTGLVDSCKWRIHVSTMGDNITVHIISLFIFYH